MIGPPTQLERIRELEGRLADVAMQAQQLFLQYGGNRRGEQVPSDRVSLDFKALRDWMRHDPAAREKPPMFRTHKDVRGPVGHRDTRQQRRATERARAKGR